jgi:hypothetical protein
MKIRHLSRVLLAAVPATVTVMALTTGTASAMPRNPCEDYANQVDEYYGDYQWWYDESMADYDAGHVDTAISDAAIALNYHDEYERAMNDAYSYGCF